MHLIILILKITREWLRKGNNLIVIIFLSILTSQQPTEDQHEICEYIPVGNLENQESC